MPDNIMAAGRVGTDASAMLHSVDIYNPDPFAAMGPLTPDESTVGRRHRPAPLTAGSIEPAKVKSVIARCVFSSTEAFPHFMTVT